MALYQQEKEKGLNWSILLLLSSAYIALSINIQGFMALLPLLKLEFALTRAQTGLYSTFFFLSATILAIFSGRLVDIMGVKKGMLLGIFSIGFFYMLHAVAPSYSFILFFAFLTGVGFSIITPAVNKGVMETVAPNRRAFSLGIMQSGIGMGGFFGAILLPVLANTIGWRQSLVITGASALLLGLLLYFFFQLAPPVGALQKTHMAPQLGKILSGLLGDRVLLGFCSLGFLLGTTNSAVISHFALFLHQDLGFSLSMAGMGLGVIHLGGIVGQPGWGYLNDTFFSSNRLWGLFFISSIMGLAMLFLRLFSSEWLLPLPLFYLFVFFFGTTSMGGHSLLFAAISEQAGIHTGTATGLALIFIRLGILASPPLFGLMADGWGSYAPSWTALGLITLFLTTFITLFIRHALKDPAPSLHH